MPGEYILVDAEDLNTIPQPQYLWRDRLQEASVAAVVAPPSTGKSFHMVHVVNSVVTQRRYHTRTGIYVAPEGASGYYERDQAWRLHYSGQVKLPNRQVKFITEPIDFTNGVEVGQLIARIQPYRPIIVVVDTLAQSMGIADENGPAMSGVIRHCNDMVKALGDACVVLVHHTTKDGLTFRGHSSFQGNVDTVIQGIDRDGIVEWSCSKQRNGAAFDSYYTTLHPVGNSRVMVPAPPDHKPQGLTRYRRAVLRSLQLAFWSDGARPSDLAAFNQIPSSVFPTVMSHLIEQGYIERDAKKDQFRVTDEGRRALMSYVREDGSALDVEETFYEEEEEEEPAGVEEREPLRAGPPMHRVLTKLPTSVETA